MTYCCNSIRCSIKLLRHQQHFGTSEASKAVTTNGSGQVTIAGKLVVNGDIQLGDGSGDTLAFFGTSGATKQTGVNALATSAGAADFSNSHTALTNTAALNITFGNTTSVDQTNLGFLQRRY